MLDEPADDVVRSLCRVLQAGDVRDLEGYDAVVLGSAVYGGRWRRDARRLLRRLPRSLGRRPLWLFSSGPVGESEADPADRWQHPSWVREALKERPGVRVVFVSGYAEDSFGETQMKIPNSVFLPKPFSLSDLTETVHQQLN